VPGCVAKRVRIQTRKDHEFKRVRVEQEISEKNQAASGEAPRESASLRAVLNLLNVALLDLLHERFAFEEIAL